MSLDPVSEALVDFLSADCQYADHTLSLVLSGVSASPEGRDDVLLLHKDLERARNAYVAALRKLP
jgi:hypothetical protein